MTTETKKKPRGMTEILAVQRAKVCWAVHMLGPDEIIPMASYEAAEKYAVDMNAFFYSGSRDMPDVLCLSVVVPCFCGQARELHMRDAERASVAGERTRP